MTQLILRYQKRVKKITVSRSSSSQDLIRLICHAFNIRQKIVGFTDNQGKFYDPADVARHIRTFSGQTLSLVTSKDLNEENMSFASEIPADIYDPEKPDQNIAPNQTLDTELPKKITEGYMGTVNDLQIFESLYLQENINTIIICFDKLEPVLSINYAYFTYKGGRDSILIYSGTKRVCQLYIIDWREAGGRIASVLGKGKEVEKKNSNKKFKQLKTEIINDSLSEQEQQEQDIDEYQITANALKNLKRLLDEETISELQFYKLKAKLFENPHKFVQKYEKKSGQSRRRQRQKTVDPQEIRAEILRSRQQKYRYQSIINQFSNPRQNYASKTEKHEIPIIVRKYNNVIQKITTSYPLSVEQEQAINLISQLQLKGLISEKDSDQYKSLVIQQDAEIFELFSSYYDEQIDQIQLSKKLKLVKNRKAQDNKGDIPEKIMKLLIKYARRGSFELLRKLAIQKNAHLLKCIERYHLSKDSSILTSDLQKIASYYQTKQFVDSLEKPKNFIMDN